MSNEYDFIIEQNADFNRTITYKDSAGDAIDITDFSKPDLKRTNISIDKVGYVGSFYKCRGIDLILGLAKLNPNKQFIMIGDIENLNKKKFNIKNITLENFKPYYQIPKILESIDILLMPYEKVVEVNSKNLNTASYCSPLKMFDYLAAAKIIFSSKLPGICEILIDNYNAILLDDTSLKKWNFVLTNLDKYQNLNQIKRNAYLTACAHTWEKRVMEIISNANVNT